MLRSRLIWCEAFVIAATWLASIYGSKDNNIIWSGQKKAYWELHNFSPFKDTNPATPSSERYKAITLGRQTVDGQKQKVLLAFKGIILYLRAPQIYLGFPMRFVPDRTRVGVEGRKTDGLSDAVFVSSQDGIRWDRTFMEAFIRPGLDETNWGGAHGNNTPAWGIIQTSDREISLYVSESYGNYPEGTNRVPRLRRSVIRVDGFVSVNAPMTVARCLPSPSCSKTSG